MFIKRFVSGFPIKSHRGNRCKVVVKGGPESLGGRREGVKEGVNNSSGCRLGLVGLGVD